MQLICKECGSERQVGRKLCTQCNSKRIQSYPRYMWTCNCKACNKEIKSHRKTGKDLCDSCRDLVKTKLKENLSTNNYEYTKLPGQTVHRNLAIEILSRQLNTNEVVHHVNDNPKDNRVENLMLMTRSTHNRLHKFLELQRAIYEKSYNPNQGNCWNNLIAPITTTWLETTNVKVIKLWEISRSAAELLNSNREHEEGSETQAPDI